ncbi:MAG: hypothetical protein FWG54_01335, partial [Bacteroidetes bacterium]|nr:hypothetical protein [Bacteroidota bacterium]
IRDTKITSVDLSKVPYLWNFAFSGSLTSLDLSMLPYLWGLYGMNVTITELDISHNTDLIQLYFEGNSLLTKLYVWWEGGRSNIPVQFTDFKVDNSVQLIGKNVAPDPVLSLLPAGVDPDSRIVECTVTPEQFRSLFTDAGFYAELRSITAQVYKMFRDDYDFIVYLPDVSETNRPSSDLRFAGINYTLSNSVQGLGRSLSSESAQWGSAGKLQSVIYLTGGYNAIGQGPILHELTHRWANSCCPTYGYNGDNYDTHWGISNAGGLLGGFKYIRTVEQNSGGVAGKTLYQASISSDKNPDGSFVRGFELGGYPNNSLPFSDIELYLMGMKSAQDLRNNNFRLDTYTGNSYDGNIVGQGYFWSTGLTSYTIDDLIVRNGQRVPDAANAQKSFRILTVLISQEGQSVHHYTEVVNDVKWLTGPAGSSIGTYQGLYNFREATGGAGTLVSDGIKNSLK